MWIDNILYLSGINKPNDIRNLYLETSIFNRYNPPSTVFSLINYAGITLGASKYPTKELYKVSIFANCGMQGHLLGA